MGSVAARLQRQPTLLRMTGHSIILFDVHCQHPRPHVHPYPALSPPMPTHVHSCPPMPRLMCTHMHSCPLMSRILSRLISCPVSRPPMSTYVPSNVPSHIHRCPPISIHVHLCPVVCPPMSTRFHPRPLIMSVSCPLMSTHVGSCPLTSTYICPPMSTLLLSHVLPCPLMRSHVHSRPVTPKSRLMSTHPCQLVSPDVHLTSSYCPSHVYISCAVHVRRLCHVFSCQSHVQSCPLTSCMCLL